MEKQEYKSKWDELAREIGAEIPPETIEREEAVATPKPAPARPVEKLTESRPLPKKTTPGWDSLADQLGLPLAPPEEKPIEARAEQPAGPRSEARRSETRQQEERRPEVRPPEEGREPPRRERPQSRRPDRPPRDQQVRGGRQDSRRGQRGDRPERDHHEKRRPPREADIEIDVEDDRPARPTREPERAGKLPERPAPPQEEPAKPAAVSLWHKIFGSPAEQTAKLIDEEPLPDASEVFSDRDEPRSAGSGFADPHTEDEAIVEHVHEFEDGDRSTDTADEGDASERKRGRPRRRRGRGRGRRSETSESEGHSSEPRESRGPRREREGERPRPERVERAERDDDFDDLGADDDLSGLDDDVEDGDEVAVGEGASPGRSALARAIPSWDEAIGFIVDTNMQSRSQRRPPSRSGPRDNGGGRGRGRGRRKP